MCTPFVSCTKICLLVIVSRGLFLLVLEMFDVQTTLCCFSITPSTKIGIYKQVSNKKLERSCLLMLQQLQCVP